MGVVENQGTLWHGCQFKAPVNLRSLRRQTFLQILASLPTERGGRGRRTSNDTIPLVQPQTPVHACQPVFPVTAHLRLEELINVLAQIPPVHIPILFQSETYGFRTFQLRNSLENTSKRHGPPTHNLSLHALVLVPEPKCRPRFQVNCCKWQWLNQITK